jgi:demethylmenaquinone methyltransferase/2-methoxy-6-polyprenyl-1,4-benzoquinol methylase
MTIKRQNRIFHWLSPCYDYLIRRPEVDRLKALLKLQPEGCLLDLGGGTGRVSRHFTGMVKTIVVGDINVSMLGQAKRKSGLLPLCLDGAALPFGSQTIDTILVVDALHHFRNRPRIIEEMIRVLKPSGRIVFEEQDIRTVFIRLFSQFERLVGFHSSFLTPLEICRLFDPYQHQQYFETGRFFSFRIAIEKK